MGHLQQGFLTLNLLAGHNQSYYTFLFFNLHCNRKEVNTIIKWNFKNLPKRNK